MNMMEFRRLKIGDVVYSHFSNSYREATIIEITEKHAELQAHAVRGGMLSRRARYVSIDTQEVGMRKTGRIPTEKTVTT